MTDPRNRNRDAYSAKSPPALVRAQTATPIGTDDRKRQRAAALRAELAQLEAGDRESEDFESLTPVTLIDPLQRLEYRQRRSSHQVENVSQQASALAVDVARIEARVEAVDEKLDKLLVGEVDDRRSREQRSEAARLELERAKATTEAADRVAVAELRRSGAAYRAKIYLAVIAAVVAICSAYFAGRGAA